MESPFAAQTMPLGQLLADPHLIEAPPYQRHFAWTQAEAGRLLENIGEALDAEGEAGDGADYFLGAMLFIEKDAPPSRRTGWTRPRASRTLEVVDGLQRLTTLTILFSVLRDLGALDGVRPNDRLLSAIASGQGANTRQRLSLRETDETFFQVHVLRQGTTGLAPATDTGSPAEARIVEVRDSFRETLGEYDAAQRGRLAAFLLDRCHVVIVATRGIDRAHRMFTVLNTSGKPLARSDVLKAMLLGSVPEAGLQKATASWDAAEARLGEGFDSVFSHIRVMYGRASTPVISGIMEIAADQGGAEKFIERVLHPSAAIFEDIRTTRHSGSPQSEAIARSLTYLGWLPAADWIPPAMLWWMERGNDANELVWFLRQLDRLAYGLRILGIGTQKRITRLGGVVTAIRNRQDLKASASPLEFSREELRTIHFNLRDLHARSAPVARLVLLRLNDHIAGGPQALPIKELTVEHVLPRKPGANSQWRGWFQDPAERDRLMECLGNLVLATRAQNDKAGNLDFARKKEVLFNTAAAPVVALNDDVRRQSEWKAAQIREREAELMRRLDALWGIGVPPPRTEAASDAGAKRRKAVAGA